MSVVVRCPWCRGLSRVSRDAVGEHVRCPRCAADFQAIEEATPVANASRPAGTRRDRPNRSTRYEQADPRGSADPQTASRDESDSLSNPQHDTHTADPHSTDQVGGLSVSVLVGLALLPFLIPLLWVIATLIFERTPELSVAAPTALAVAASALCLAMVYTIDWSQGTRVKGVLLVVTLTYLAGVGLYLLRKDDVDRVREVIEDRDWKEFQPPSKGYRIKLPGRPVPDGTPPLEGWQLEAFRAYRKQITGERYQYVVGYGPDAHANLEDGDWVRAVGRSVTGGRADPEPAEVTVGDIPGRQWIITLPDGVTSRIVQVCRRDKKVYYLAAEGPNLHPEDDAVRLFFDSFHVNPPRQ